MSKNTTTNATNIDTAATRRRRRLLADRRARIEQVKQDLLWAIEQTQREIRALEAYIAENQPKPPTKVGGER